MYLLYRVVHGFVYIVVYATDDISTMRKFKIVITSPVAALDAYTQRSNMSLASASTFVRSRLIVKNVKCFCRSVLPFFFLI